MRMLRLVLLRLCGWRCCSRRVGVPSCDAAHADAVHACAFLHSCLGSSLSPVGLGLKPSGLGACCCCGGGAAALPSAKGLSAIDMTGLSRLWGGGVMRWCVCWELLVLSNGMAASLAPCEHAALLCCMHGQCSWRCYICSHHKKKPPSDFHAR
jgi:hypothetical protein